MIIPRLYDFYTLIFDDLPKVKQGRSQDGSKSGLSNNCMTSKPESLIYSAQYAQELALTGLLHWALHLNVC